MERMSEHTCLISSLSLLLVQTEAARWKAATPQQLTGAKLYLDIAKSGYLFHGYSGVINSLITGIYIVAASSSETCSHISSIQKIVSIQRG